VINASLYGAICALKSSSEVDHIYGAMGGMGGFLRERFIDLGTLPGETLEKLPFTPASAIGTSRDAVGEESYAAIVRVLRDNNICYVLLTGGNGTMDMAGKICRAAIGTGICVVGIPKTIDNDLAVTDHAPGFGSMARYIAASVREVAMDVASLPIHVSVVEAMGRNAGWITAASALAREGGPGPDLILPPEVPFDEEAFLDAVETLSRRQGGVVVVASEGLKNKKGETIVEPIFTVGRSVYYGDVGAHLVNLVIKKLQYKARSEKPGIIGRASAVYQSETDRDEAILAGSEAAKAALTGRSGVMVGFTRSTGSAAYRCETILIPVEDVMLHEKTLPPEFIAEGGMDVTPAFYNWCRPLIGSSLPISVCLRSNK
jgi:6-phosphofructokinase 1